MEKSFETVVKYFLCRIKCYLDLKAILQNVSPCILQRKKENEKQFFDNTEGDNLVKGSKQNFMSLDWDILLVEWKSLLPSTYFLTKIKSPWEQRL